jgi:HEAT repeat protein
VRPKAALKALAMFEHREQLPVALEYLTSTDPELRHLAREACKVLLDPRSPDGRAVAPLVRALRFAGSSKEELLPLIGLLGRSGSPRAAQSLTVLASGSDDVRIRAASLEALGFLGRAAPSRVLLQGLDDEVGSVRWAAALALRRVGQPGAALPLVDRFEVMTEQDRRVVGVALGGSLQHVTASRLLARVANLVSTSRAEDRDALIEALGQARDRSVVSRLARLAQSLGPADRSKIAEALAGHRSAVRVLEQLASDPVSSVRANATWALGSTGTRAALRPLVRLLKDPSATVAANAAGALGLIAAQTKSSVGEVLCQALADGRAYVRVNALGALGVAGECCPTEVLALLEHDREEMVRAAAAVLVQRQLERFAESATAVLARCAKSDPASSVAVACATRPEPIVDETEPVLVYVIPVAEAEPVAGAPFALIRDDGLVRLGASDRRGAVFERAAPRGRVRLGVAAPFLR